MSTLTLCTLLFSGCGRTAVVPANTPPPSSLSQATPRASVTISNFSFSPQALSVKRGTTVTWKNEDNASHTITGEAGGPTSGMLSVGGKYSFVFNEAGTFRYHCSVHPDMTGTVTVAP